MAEFFTTASVVKNFKLTATERSMATTTTSALEHCLRKLYNYLSPQIIRSPKNVNMQNIKAYFKDKEQRGKLIVTLE